jgi:hypothetical protein
MIFLGGKKFGAAFGKPHFAEPAAPQLLHKRIISELLPGLKHPEVCTICHFPAK